MSTLLLRTYEVRGADEFGGATELRANASSGYLCRSFASTHERSRIKIEADTGFDWQRSSSEHEVVELR